mgnify:CR=1 FL=1
MKKAMKKLMAALLAVAMVCAMAIPAFADGSSSTSTAPVTTLYTIAAPHNGHTYEIYQIFTGDYDALQPSMLTNIKWGKNGTGKAGDAVEQTVLDALSKVASYTSDSDKLDVIDKYVTLTNPVETITNGGSVEVVGGYYLIKDKDGTVPSSETYTPYIVSVVGNVTIEPKSNEVPKFTKKLKDTNDTTGVITGWQDSADYDIDDKIPFRLQGTVSKDFDSYKTYYYAFHDVEEKGLTFDPSSVKVFVGDEETGTKIDASNYTVVTNPADGCTFEIVFDDLKNIPSVTAKSIITVTYESTLNGNAVLGAQGNVNTAKLEYSNNPRGNGTGTTPWDNVIVFTYKVVVNKVDQNRQPLEGAEFTLTKKLKDGTENVIPMKIDTSNKALFTLSGLDDGVYTLTETVTPAHYNTISPITFTVNADHTITWEADPRNTVLTSLSGNTASGEITFTHNETDGSLTTDVVNNIGTTLPGTGGIGTTIFYVIGGGLMVAAAILLITKKRMENR